ncbi:hypothetical protein [Membranihabitans maritimus]|uniref:hypothetical protein n=1 Tax=Membranihabitans maritimus TaxID=2904244 RepID=UPI001F3C8DF0|nr:hypothetical protein [Membranihabitans maritimus]
MYSVITGDIVDSSRDLEKGAGDPYEVIHQILYDIFDEFQGKGWLGTGDYAIYRGDSFQCISRAEDGLLLGILIKAALKGGRIKSVSSSEESTSWDCRMAIGIGTVSYKADTVEESNGEAFIKSGRLLDKIDKRFLAFATPWKSIQAELDLMAKYLDIILHRLWTPATATTVLEYLLHHPTQTELASILKISQPAVNRRLHGAEIEVLEMTLERYRSIIKLKLQ